MTSKIHLRHIHIESIGKSNNVVLLYDPAYGSHNVNMLLRNLSGPFHSTLAIDDADVSPTDGVVHNIFRHSCTRFDTVVAAALESQRANSAHRMLICATSSDWDFFKKPVADQLMFNNHSLNITAVFLHSVLENLKLQPLPPTVRANCDHLVIFPTSFLGAEGFKRLYLVISGVFQDKEYLMKLLKRCASLNLLLAIDTRGVACIKLPVTCPPDYSNSTDTLKEWCKTVEKGVNEFI